MVKNGQGPKDCVSHKWLDELSRLSEWFLHADSDEINSSLLFIFDI